MVTPRPNPRPLAWLMLLGIGLLVLAGCSKEKRVAAHLENADRFYTNREFEKAKIEYINALRLQRTNSGAIQRLGKILFLQDQVYDARDLLLVARDAFPEDLETREQLIAVFANISRHATNSEHYLDLMRVEIDAVLERQPTNEIALLALTTSRRTPEETAALVSRIQDLRRQAGDQAIFDVAEGTLLTNLGQTNAAETAFRQAITRAPQAPVPHHAYGEFLSAIGRRAEAESELRTAAELAPPGNRARKAWARFLVASGRIADAKAVLDDILAKAPEQTSTWISRAEISLHEKDFDLAKEFIDRALSQAPRDGDALRTLGQIHLARKQLDPAIEAFRAALSRTPTLKQPPLLYELALAYLSKRDGVNSSAALEYAVRLQPTLTPAVLLLAELNLARGRTEDAIQALRDLLERTPKLERAHLLLIRAYTSAGRTAEASQAARNGLEQLPNSPSLAFQLGLTLRQASNFDEARTAFEAAGRLTTNQLPVVQQLFELDLAQSNAPNALLRIEQEIARNPDAASLLLLKGRAHQTLGQIDQAEAAFRRCVELDSAQSDAAFELLARLYLDSGRHAEAARQLEELLARHKDRSDQWMLYGILQQERKEYDLARKAYEEALKLSPKSPVVILNNLAYLLSEHFDDLPKAYEAAQKARNLAPDNPAVADTLGWLEHRQGRYLQAAQLLAEAANRIGEHPEVQYHVGMNLYMMGQEDAARLALREATRASLEYPGKDLARERLAFLESPAPRPDDAAAMAALAQRTQDNPRDLVALLRLADVRAATGDADAALKSLDAALQTSPDASSVLVRLARLHAGPLKQPAKALDYARAARQRAPSDPEIAHTLGRLAFSSSDQSWAYSLLQESARRLPDRADVAADLAWAAYSQGRIEESIQSMEKAAASQPSPDVAANARTFLAMTGIHRQPPRLPPAEEIQSVLQSDPNHVPALMALGLFAESRNQPAEARDAYERALARFPDFSPAVRQLAILFGTRLQDDAKAYDLGVRARQAFPRDEALAGVLGSVLSRRGEHRYAIQLLTEATRSRTNDAALFYHLGVSQQALNQVSEGRASLTAAVSLAPQDAAFLADARQRLATLAQATNSPTGRPN